MNLSESIENLDRAVANDALIALDDLHAAIADCLVKVVNSPSNIEGYSRSVAARKAKTDLLTATRLLGLLAAAGHIRHAGNGARIRFHAYRVSS